MKSYVERDHWEQQKIEKISHESRGIKLCYFLGDLVLFLLAMYLLIGSLVKFEHPYLRWLLAIVGCIGSFRFGNQLRIRLYIYLQ